MIGSALVLGEPASGVPFLTCCRWRPCLSLLGQPLHPRHKCSLAHDLILLGLGLGTLTTQGRLAHAILLLLLLILLSALLYRHQPDPAPDAWRGLSSFSLGLIATLLALTLSHPASNIATLGLAPRSSCCCRSTAACRHGGRLAGQSPAFLAVAVAHGRVSRSPGHSPDPLRHRCSAPWGFWPSRVPLRVAAGIDSVATVAAPGLCRAGLLSACSGGMSPIREPRRFRPRSISAPWGSPPAACCWPGSRSEPGNGDVDFEHSAAWLSYARFSAARTARARSPGHAAVRRIFRLLEHYCSCRPLRRPPPAIIMLVWLTASWYQIELVQQLVFGRARLEVRYEDLRQTSSCSACCCFLLVVSAPGPRLPGCSNRTRRRLPCRLPHRGNTWIR